LFSTQDVQSLNYLTDSILYANSGTRAFEIFRYPNESPKDCFLLNILTISEKEKSS